MARSSRTPSPTSLVLVALASALPAHAVGQSGASVSVEENFRRAPNDVVVARLSPGAAVTVVGREGNWLEVDVEGWVWLASLQVSERELDLVVSATDGENLRDAPQGNVIGRLQEGALLTELSREPGWAHVRRRGWIWSASVSEATTSAPTPAPAASTPANPPAPSPAATRPPEGFTTVVDAPILTAPDGDTLAISTARSDLQVLSREGNWARVRVEGWVWMPPSATVGAGDGPATLTPEDLTSEPDAHVGRVVDWSLQFISLDRAEELRTDFRRGEPFLLTRYGGAEGPYVYVAVPPEMEAEADGLVPLEMIAVTARVRTGASFTGTPIVDLLTLERRR